MVINTAHHLQCVKHGNHRDSEPPLWLSQVWGQMPVTVIKHLEKMLMWGLPPQAHSAWGTLHFVDDINKTMPLPVDIKQSYASGCWQENAQKCNLTIPCEFEMERHRNNLRCITKINKAILPASVGHLYELWTTSSLAANTWQANKEFNKAEAAIGCQHKNAVSQWAKNPFVNLTEREKWTYIQITDLQSHAVSLVYNSALQVKLFHSHTDSSRR